MIVSSVTARGSGAVVLLEVDAGTRKEAVSMAEAEICFCSDRWWLLLEEEPAKGVVLVPAAELPMGPPALMLPAFVFLMSRMGVNGSVLARDVDSNVGSGVGVSAVGSIQAAARAACKLACAVE